MLFIVLLQYFFLIALGVGYHVQNIFGVEGVLLVFLTHFVDLFVIQLLQILKIQLLIGQQLLHLLLLVSPLSL